MFAVQYQIDSDLIPLSTIQCQIDPDLIPLSLIWYHHPFDGVSFSLNIPTILKSQAIRISSEICQPTQFKSIKSKGLATLKLIKDRPVKACRIKLRTGRFRLRTDRYRLRIERLRSYHIIKIAYFHKNHLMGRESCIRIILYIN